MAGFKKQNPGCNCCAPTGTGCVNCENSDAPATFEVVFSGIVDDTCTGSAALNATWNVPRVGGASSCSWQYFLSAVEADGLQLDVSPCGCQNELVGVGGGDQVDITVAVFDSGGGNYRIEVKINFNWGGLHTCPATRTILFLKTYTTGRPDCDGLVDESIPFNSQTAVNYTASGATCLVTAL